MPLIAPSSYEPPTQLWNGHMQTIIPSLFRKVQVSYVRERIETPDDDFLDIDWAFGKSAHKTTGEQQSIDGFSSIHNTQSTKSQLVILTHGLEGNSGSQYLAGMVRHLTQNGLDCLAWHLRSCSGELNRQQRFYHIGETGDLHFIIQHALSKGYQTIYLMGFSAGGNVTLKYLGENSASHGDNSLSPAIKKAVVFSVPVDLMGSARRLEQWDSLAYNYRFNRTLKRKVLQKAAVMPGVFPTEAVTKARSIREFDNLFTAPMNGFQDVTDYYTRSSSLQFIPNITVPTLLVSAKNDPFLSPECFPEELGRELPNVWMEFPEQGGHCGFPPRTGGIQGIYWSEERTLQFLQTTEG
ncbi:YheT family hydrolase [Spirosoma flavum]|uniref:YheT family hydrolase n=1 Tax=Spirosoma flavum TaxID=2048557 RepID=A0ABW6AEI6_9BACT